LIPLSVSLAGGWISVSWRGLVLIHVRPGLQVWSLVRSFDQPQRYKPFVSRCVLRGGDLEIGSVREVNVKTGLPATTSTERLEQLDDDEHILSVKFVGGDHRLRVRASHFVLFFLQYLPNVSVQV
jgi:hypothetical protein